MDTIDLVYLGCFFLGLGFAIISGLFSGVFSGGAEADVDIGGGDVDVGGGDVDVGGADGAVHFSPLSPVTLTMFIATFGGSGYIFKKILGWPWVAHVPVSAVSGLVVAGIVFYIFYKVFSATQGTSHGKMSQIVGQEIELIVPIPSHGLGEAAYTLSGVRRTAPAKTADGKELPAHTIVKVVKLVGNTLVVEKSP